MKKENSGKEKKMNGKKKIGGDNINQENRNTMKSIKMLLSCMLISMMALPGISGKSIVANPNGDNSSDESINNENGGIQVNFYEERIPGLYARYHAYDGSVVYLF
jgi:hypothetical protein